ncbi:MAG: hypothetical protein QG559_1244 [Campylobacterota bacterium]|nr:hypothetical protein [Campylobacterota bacterium]
MKFIVISVLFFISLFGDEEHHHRNKELSHLELSKEQGVQMKKILKDFRTELKEFDELKDDIENAKKELFLKENLDIVQLDKLNAKTDSRAREIEVNFLIKVHALLHPKQRERFIYYFDDWEVK